MLRLTLRAGDRVQVFSIPRQPQVLGSGEDCELRCTARGISRRHARLVGVAGGLRVEDVGSRNGMWLQGKRCTEAVLEPGQRLQLGEAWLVVEEVSTSDAEAELVVRGGRSVAEASEHSTGTAGGALAPPGSVAAVLPLVRLLERSPVPPVGAGRERLLEKARLALGAETLLVLRLVRGELAIAEWSGAEADHGIPDALSAELSRSRRGDGAVPVETERGIAFLCGSRSSPWSLAAIPGLGSPFEPSGADLVAYLAETLLSSDAPAATRTRSAEAEPDLPIPAGMVIGSSPIMRELVRAMRSTAASQQHVLLLGENGTGKERFAHLVHDLGGHAKGPYVPINCAAIPGELFEAEMFGVHGRAATGVDPRVGHFARAEGGTLFLDEIGDLREDLQAKLLRALQEREIAPVGGGGARQINVRVITASNRDLDGEVRAGKFRQDLYYRLRGRTFRIPPLRERSEDLPELVLVFVTRFAARYRRHVLGVAPRALRLLRGHDWPGNVRELENACEAAVLLCPQGGVIGVEHFPDVRAARESGADLVGSGPGEPEGSAGGAAASARQRAPDTPTSGGGASGTGEVGDAGGLAGIDMRARVHEFQRRALVDALAQAHGNKSKAAKILGINRATLYSWLERLGLKE